MPNQSPFDAFHGLNQPELVQDIKAKSEPVAKQATSLYRALRDELNQRDLFFKPQNHAGEVKSFAITDKSRRVYSFPLCSNGKRWEVGGPSIMSYLNFLEHIIRTQKGFPSTLKEAIASQSKHLAFHKRIIDAHPLIGTSLLLARHISNDISERLEKSSRATPHSESRNQAVPMGLRKNATISHHSREFIAKDEYFIHFSHILASIKEGLEQPVR